MVLFDQSNKTGAADVKMNGSVLEKKPFLTFPSKSDWGSYNISIAKTASKKIGALICSIKFLSPEPALYLHISTIPPCMEYCCHAWASAPSCYLELLDSSKNRYALDMPKRRKGISFVHKLYISTCKAAIGLQMPSNISLYFWFKQFGNFSLKKAIFKLLRLPFSNYLITKYFVFLFLFPYIWF